MSEKLPTPQTEEVDLGKLFQVIGKGIKNFFNGIFNLLKQALHYLILLLIFFKKHAVIIGIATILGGILGYVLEMNNTKDYQSDMLLITNYGSGHQLYSKTTYLNALINKGETADLAALFNISKEEAANLTGFMVAPNDIENNLLREYDYYMQHTDTIYTRNFTVEDFDKRLDLADYKVQKLTAFATNQTIFNKLNTGVLKLAKNDFYKKILKIKTDELDFRKSVLSKNLATIDSLRKRYKEVDLIAAKKSIASGTNINLAETKTTRNKDTDLFIESNKILTSLKEVDSERLQNGYVAKIQSEFSIGVQKSNYRSEKWFKYAVLGFILSLLTILGLKLNTYLNNYQK